MRVKQRITRRTLKQHLTGIKKLLSKLRHLAKEVQRKSRLGPLRNAHMTINIHDNDIIECALTFSDLICDQPQNTIPDVFLWLLSGSKRLAYVRIPAHSVIFSLVEDQRGRDCGRVTTLYMKVCN